MTDDELRAENQELRGRVARLDKQLQLTAKAWKDWEKELKDRDNEIALLKDALERAQRIIGNAIKSVPL